MGMNEPLKQFVKTHPEFFQPQGEMLRLREDIHELMDHYARLVDSDEYHRVRGMVESIRRENCGQLEGQIQHCKSEIARQQELQAEVQSLIQAQEQSICSIEVKLVQLEVEQSNVLRVYSPWYCSNFIFWLLAIFGVIFTYIGVFLRVSGASGFLLVGIGSLMGGLYLQSRNPTYSHQDLKRSKQIEYKIADLKTELRVLKVKRVTLVQQKNIAKDVIDGLLLSIKRNHQMLKTLNG